MLLFAFIVIKSAIKCRLYEIVRGISDERVTAPLRITDGRWGKAEAPVVTSRAFQLTTYQVRAAPDVVTSM